jgi:hypothetical protein
LRAVVDHHVDRPDVQARRRAQLTGPNRSTDLPRPSGKSSPESREQRSEISKEPDPSFCHPPSDLCPPPMPMPVSTAPPPLLPKKKRAGAPDVSLAWWSWRGCPTRSHSELGRETPQRPWYCALRHGRVGRRQANQTSGPESRDQSSYRPVEVPTDAAPLVRRRCECRTHPSGVRKAGMSG